MIRFLNTSHLPAKMSSMKRFRASSHDIGTENPFKSRNSVSREFVKKKKKVDKLLNKGNSRKNSLYLSKSKNFEISPISEERSKKIEKSFEKNRERKIKGKRLSKIFTKRNYFDKNKLGLSHSNIGILSKNSKFVKKKSKIFDKSRSIANFKELCEKNKGKKLGSKKGPKKEEEEIYLRKKRP